MEKVYKGGIIYLLSYFIVLGVSQSQETITVYSDPLEKNYGKVLSPSLPDTVILKIYSQNLFFPDWTSFFSIKTENGTRSILGKYSIENSRIAFTPRFLPDPDVNYLISFNYQGMFDLLNIHDSSTVILTETVSFDPPETKPTKVLNTYPLVNVLPANALKLYIYFSAPMGFENPYEFISLIDQNDRVIENAFVEVPEGLWNADRTRLTLHFHPGRVKQGVGPNMKEGAVLMKGELYKLVIKDGWRDSNGKHLVEPFEKKFFVENPVRKKLKIKSWKVYSKCKDECEIKLATGSILDIEMAKKLISIKNEELKEISFKILPESNGTIIIESNQILKGKTYYLNIHPRLEDMSGNTFLNPFDYHENSRVTEGKPIEKSFTVK